VLDIFLNWFVIAIPFLATVGAAVLSLKLPHERHYGNFVWGAVVVGLGFSALTYWQQIRTSQQAEASQREAIATTARTVSRETIDNVTVAVGKQYKDLIASLTDQNQKLAAQLSAQGKDVGVIKSSNIVTGKHPIKVELTNASSSGADASDRPLANLSWTQQADVPRDGKPSTVVNFRLDNSLELPAFLVVCDRPCRVMDGMAPPMSQTTTLTTANVKVVGLLFNAPRPLSGGINCKIFIGSLDDQPVAVDAVRIIKRSELPMEFR